MALDTLKVAAQLILVLVALKVLATWTAGTRFGAALAYVAH